LYSNKRTPARNPPVVKQRRNKYKNLASVSSVSKNGLERKAAKRAITGDIAILSLNI